jgi:hypothetical protein
VIQEIADGIAFLFNTFYFIVGFALGLLTPVAYKAVKEIIRRISNG